MFIHRHIFGGHYTFERVLFDLGVDLFGFDYKHDNRLATSPRVSMPVRSIAESLMRKRLVRTRWVVVPLCYVHRAELASFDQAFFRIPPSDNNPFICAIVLSRPAAAVHNQYGRRRV